MKKHHYFYIGFVCLMLIVHFYNKIICNDNTSVINYENFNHNTYLQNGLRPLPHGDVHTEPIPNYKNEPISPKTLPSENTKIIIQ